MEAIKQPLTNVQLELLKVFSHELKEEDLLELRKVLVEFFARKAIALANKAWDEKGWADEDVDRLLNTKLRIKSNK